jgi:ureidoglycolate lyase
MRTLKVEPLTAAAFASFGDVIDAASATERITINEGTAERLHGLARVDVAGDGHGLISLCRAQPRALPFEVRVLERHPLGSQAFVPLGPSPRWVVVVATDPSAKPRAFLATNGQGINYHRGTWHHPLIALDRAIDFVVVDRGGGDANCDEVALADPWLIAHV